MCGEIVNKREIILTMVLIVIFIYIAANMGAINTFLTANTGKSIDLDHTTVVVPEPWNTTIDMGMIDKSKNGNAITNGYIVFDFFEDWPESQITGVSRAKLTSLENGNYEVLKTSNIDLGGTKISKEYFRNPSRDTDTVWDCVGVTYVFNKENCNYAIQAHYFTKNDFKNQTYCDELDDRVEDFIANMHNWHYDGLFSPIFSIAKVGSSA